MLFGSHKLYSKLYQVETKWINEAEKNNSDKFPEGYFFIVSNEIKFLRSKISILKYEQ